MSELSDLAVIIPAYDAGRTLARCLDRIVLQLGADDEIVVVDDGSSDDTAAIAERAGVRVVSQDRGGAGAARNLGVRHTRAPWLLFVDADVYLPDGMVERIRAAVEGLEEQDALVTVYEPAPVHRNAGSVYFHLGQAHRMHSLRPGPTSVFGSSCAAVRRTAFESVGGFLTEQRFAGSEDRMFGELLGGARVMLRTDFMVVHDKFMRVADVLRLDARRAHSEARWRMRRRRMGAVLGRDSKGYLGLGYMARLLSAPFVLLAPAVPLAALPHLLASLPLLRFVGRHAGLRATLTAAGIGWIDSMTVLAAGLSGAAMGILTAPER